MSITAVKTPLIAAVSFLLGATAGGYAAYKYTANRLEAEFEEQLIVETAQIRVFYANKKDFATPGEAVKALIPEEPLGTVIQEPHAVGEKPQKVPYHLMSPNSAAAKVVEENYTLPGAEEVATNLFQQVEQNNEQIYPIVREDFELGERDYVQTTLSWYPIDSVLSDTNDDIIEDLIGTIGQLAINKLTTGAVEDNSLCVRNDILGVDFEIVFEAGQSHSEEVFGVPYEPPAPRPSGRE